ncbi:hypothetical protein MNV49_005139 [Pseudohyphozyma bogoriensis]|nr:hypothetical protein MNV49_005139 [Pseudohyphozyma bogoriensis]
MRGFWIGGLMTAFRDGISSGIFFSGTFVGKRLLRGESPFSPSPDLDAIPKVFKDGRFNGSEIGRTFLAGGVAGLLSAVVPYPVDIIKTRLQTSTVQSKADHTTPAAPLTARSVARQIHRDGQEAFRYSYPTTRVYNFLSTSVFPPNTGPGCKLVDGRPVPNPKAEKWALRVLGLKGFTVGLRPTTADGKVKVLSVNVGQHIDPEYYKSLDDIIEWTVIDQGSREEMIPVINKTVDEQGPFEVFVIFLKWGQPVCYPLDEGVMSHLVETGCKMVTIGGAGFDFADIDWFTSKNVFYANNPIAMAIRTADSCAMMIMMAMRKSALGDHNTRIGKFKDNSVVALDARRSTIGLIGMGKIGQYVAQHMQHFGMKVIYTKRTRLPESEENGANFATMDELLATSDVISLHCPLNAKTRGLIGAAEIAKMKDGVILVNTARGPVMDEEALCDALDSGKVASAALDVFNDEPNVNPRIQQNYKINLSPHVAVYNHTVAEDEQLEVLNNVVAYVKTGVPNTPVNLV